MKLKAYFNNFNNMNFLKSLNNHKSFTLIELLVVIAIIGLLASIIIVNLTGTRSKANIARGLQFSQSVHHALGAYAVGVWSFDEGSGTIAYDASGYGNNGTLVNGPVWRCANIDPNYTPSGTGCSLSFDGVDDYVNVPHSASLDTPYRTYSAWVKNPTQSGVPPDLKILVSKEVAYQGGMYLNRFTTPHSINYYEYISGVVKSAYVALPADNVWYFITGTFDGTAMRLYINGVLKSTVVVSGTIDSNNQPVRIGGGISGRYVIGLIDEVRIYEKALETAQIEALYYAGLDSLLARGLMDKQEYQQRLVRK